MMLSQSSRHLWGMKRLLTTTSNVHSLSAFTHLYSSSSPLMSQTSAFPAIPLPSTVLAQSYAIKKKLVTKKKSTTTKSATTTKKKSSAVTSKKTKKVSHDDDDGDDDYDAPMKIRVVTTSNIPKRPSSPTPTKTTSTKFTPSNASPSSSTKFQSSKSPVTTTTTTATPRSKSQLPPSSSQKQVNRTNDNNNKSHYEKNKDNNKNRSFAAQSSVNNNKFAKNNNFQKKYVNDSTTTNNTSAPVYKNMKRNQSFNKDNLVNNNNKSNSSSFMKNKPRSNERNNNKNASTSPLRSIGAKNDDPLKIRFDERHTVTILYRYHQMIAQQKQNQASKQTESESQTPLDLFVHRYMKQNNGIGSINRNNISQTVYDMTRWMLLLNYLAKSQAFFNKHKWLIDLKDDLHRQQVAHALKLKEQQDGQQVSGMQLFQDRRVIDDIVDWRMKYYIFNLIKNELNQIIESGEITRLSVLPEDLEIPDNILVSCPAELFDMFERDLGKEKAMKFCLINMSQAPVFLRLNPLRVESRDYFVKLIQAKLDDPAFNAGKSSKDESEESKKKKGVVQPCKSAPWGVRLSRRFQFRDWEEYENGLFEIQDEGSQMVGELMNPEPGQLVMDYCAGSGGKTLSFAHKMKNTGQIYITDIRDHVLLEAKKRMKRAGIQNIQPLTKNHPHLARMKYKMDWVLVDVPCSGTGTLRRNPELKYRISAEWISRLVKTQREIFDESFQYLKRDPDSRIVYATCSVFKRENEDQIEYFKKKYGLKEVGERISFLPQYNGYDGLFGVVLAPIQ